MKNKDLLIGELIQTARICRTMKAELLLEHGLYAGQDRMLKELERQDGQSMSELAKSLQVRPPTITKMVSRMAAQGVVERKSSDTDNRQSHVFITPAGNKLLKKVDKAWKKTEKTALKKVKNKQQKKLLKNIRRISTNIQKRNDLGQNAD